MTVDWIYDSHVMKVLQVVIRRKLKLQLLKKMQVLSCIINIYRQVFRFLQSRTFTFHCMFWSHT